MEPIILGSQDPAWFKFLQIFGPLFAIIVTAIVTWFISQKNIKAQFSLKREEINIYKERVLLELKFNLLKEIEKIRIDFALAIEHEREFRLKLVSLRDRSTIYFPNENLSHEIQTVIRKNKELIRLEKKKRKSKKEEKKVSKLTDEILDLLTVIQKHIADQLEIGNE